MCDIAAGNSCSERCALGEPAQLEHHAEVLMHDFAACLLMELQQGMLNLSVGMMSLSTIVDQPDVFGYSGATDEVPRRQGTEEARWQFVSPLVL